MIKIENSKKEKVVSLLNTIAESGEYPKKIQQDNSHLHKIRRKKPIGPSATSYSIINTQKNPRNISD